MGGVPITASSTRLTFETAVADGVTDYTVNQRRSTPELRPRCEE